MVRAFARAYSGLSDRSTLLHRALPPPDLEGDRVLPDQPPGRGHLVLRASDPARGQREHVLPARDPVARGDASPGGRRRAGGAVPFPLLPRAADPRPAAADLRLVQVARLAQAAGRPRRLARGSLPDAALPNRARALHRRGGLLV